MEGHCSPSKNGRKEWWKQRVMKLVSLGGATAVWVVFWSFADCGGSLEVFSWPEIMKQRQWELVFAKAKATGQRKKKQRRGSSFFCDPQRDGGIRLSNDNSLEMKRKGREWRGAIEFLCRSIMRKSLGFWGLDN
ncbi:hypothetical protein HAX54_053333 [Datura stramonium]|uniref:Transmembrane protein n=1 Tax=Datura stramonium TaxID=4076 RepID=A0ABS8RRV1_DATST|nr:hypothetical protein [Datura stramonium]